MYPLTVWHEAFLTLSHRLNLGQGAFEGKQKEQNRRNSWNQPFSCRLNLSHFLLLVFNVVIEEMCAFLDKSTTNPIFTSNNAQSRDRTCIIFLCAGSN